MAISVELRYCVKFGAGDSSDWSDWTIQLEGKAEEAYLEAKRRGVSFEDYPILRAALDEAYDEIRDVETDNFLECDDEYVQECTGRYPVDPYDINELVENRDKHTLEFFGLTEMSEKQLAKWDAYDLEDLPDVCDFQEDFEATSPFAEGWELNVEFAEDPLDLMDEED